MVKNAKHLDWLTCDCELRWESPKTVRRPDDIYVKLWGLFHTINTTGEDYQTRITTGKNARSRAVAEMLLREKCALFPGDDFPLIAFHPTHQSYTDCVLQQGGVIALTIAFGGAHRHLANQWLAWFAKRLTLENTGFSLANAPTLSTHSQQLPPLTPTQLEKIAQATANHAEQTVFIDTPANLSPQKHEKREFESLSKAETQQHLLINHTRKRLMQWFPEQQQAIEKWFDDYRDILLDSPVCWHYLQAHHQIKTASKSSPRDKNGNPKVQFHQGHVGHLTLRGAWVVLDALWQVLFSIHLLGQRAKINGLGYVQPETLAKPAQSLWHRHIVNKKHIHHAINEVLSQNDLEPEIDERGRVMEETALCELIHTQLTTNTFAPKPTEAFYIDKKSGGKRLLEQISQFDLFVHRLIFHTLAPIVDTYQSPLSLGYRKGYSRSMAQEKVQSLIDDGYNWIIEADIEDFFNSVPFEPLWQRLRELLPKRDEKTLALIQALMQVPFTTSSHTKSSRIMTHERQCGLMQGSPLSPILSNLYLAQLDDAFNDEALVFVRYADDVLIFCRGAHNAHETKAWLGEQLSDLGLQLAMEKTVITAVKDGFEFLGYRFDREGAEDKSALPILRQRKPAMISGNSKYLGLNGGAIEIRESRPTKRADKRHPVATRQLVQVIPLRRISQLIIFGNHSLSSPLLSVCAKERISVHFVNQWGFQVGTMSPSNADFFAVSAKQYQRHQDLKLSEQISIAGDLVGAKIHNYQTWIKNSYRKGDAKTYNQLTRIREQITACTTTAEIMGYEGEAAKACFIRLQQTMLDEQHAHFSSRRRSRGGKDRLNSLLNFGYYWLFTRISALVRSHGLNPYLSFLHESNQNYETLVYDLMEPFRVQVDKTVLRLINRKQLQARDFHLHAHKGWQLNSDALHLFTNQLESTFDSKINHTVIKDIMILQVHAVHDWAVNDESLVWFHWHEKETDAQFTPPEPETT